MPCAFRSDDPHPGTRCQFNVPQNELIAVGDHQWCQFHLPLMTEAGETLKADWDRAQVNSFNEAVLAQIDGASREDRIVDFTGVIFPPGANLKNLRGKTLPEVTFIQATFGGNVSFKLKFGKDANFNKATFLGRADFNGAVFYKSIFFEEAVFEDVATLRNVKFNGVARFKGARFNGVATFQGVIFNFRADFSHTRWLKGVIFDDAAFAGEAIFKRAEFNGDAMFAGDLTREKPGLHDIFRKSVEFQDARFERRAVFTNRRFLNNTNFGNVIFAIAPEFYNCALHQGTSFSGTQFLDRRSAEVDAAMAYRTLKVAMANVRATDDEERFFSLEQRNLRTKPDTTRSVKLFSILYEATADYGRSLALPAVWFSFVFFLFFLLYAWFGGPALWQDSGSIWRFALQQVFQPFFVFRTGATEPGQATPVWLAILAAVHSVLSLSFLALFLLALRRRFRLH